MLKVLTTALAVASAHAAPIDECSGYGDCGDCLQHDYCGWCSPSPVIYNNGTTGARCADQRDAPWVCENLYQTTKCVRGWTCDAAAGQCVQAAPGEGDTKAHCDLSCKKVSYFKCNFGNATCSSCANGNEPGCQKFDSAADCTKGCATPPELYQCDALSQTCSACPQSYCTTNKDCPGSYCDIKGPGPWTCHGSTCSQKDKCQADCGLNPLLVGVWRGVQIDADYVPGEWSMDITAAGDVTVEDPSGKMQGGKITKATDNTLVMSIGGKSYNGTWKSWEPTPETESVAFSWAPLGAAGPASTGKAMNGGGYQVYAMQKCKANVGPQCNFTSALSLPAAHVRKLSSVGKPTRIITPDVIGKVRGMATRSGLPMTPIDHCNVNADCSSCLNDPSGLCGWCDTPVKYDDGQKGAQCAGFDPDGKADPSWTCNVRYRRESCFDYGCDFTDPSNPTCKQLPQGQSGISKEKCELGCKEPKGMYRCNNQTFQCEACHIEYCTSDKDCPNSYCQIDTSKPGPYICHGGGAAADCSDHGHCNATCSVPILGIWRGIEVSHNFARGEWDFTASSEGTLTWKAPDGTKTTALMHGGDQSAVSAGIAITLTTEDGHPIGMVTATELRGIFLLDEKGNENIVNMVTLAFSSSEQPTDFAMAMKDSEFVLLACDDQSPVCDFSKSKVAPSDLI